MLTAHEHNYSNRVIDNSFSEYGLRFTNRIHQVITGGAGAPLNSVIRDHRNFFRGPVGAYHYVVIDVFDERVLFNAYDVKGNQLDSFEVINICPS